MLMRYQHFIPQHLLSRMLGKLATCRCRMIKNSAIKAFIAHYHVDMSIADRQQVQQYEHFNDFFTRTIKADARKIDSDINGITSPVDGSISEFGSIQEHKLLQAKGKHYSLQQLLAGDNTLASTYKNGEFLTAYLAPKDYHRIHMPIDATLKKMTYVPGTLFSVNQRSVNHVDGIFSRNERVICEFTTAHGPMILILVGAMIVGSMATSWHGVISPRSNCVQQWDYQNNPVTLKKGEELGYFQMGSTVIMLFPKNTLHWKSELKPGAALQMGEKIATLTTTHQNKDKNYAL